MGADRFDYIVVGSGFGGSVSALRLAQKGYRVAVIERGRRFTAKDFPRTNWRVRKSMWLPSLGCYGIQGIAFLQDVMVLHGAGVGGGSLVYAAVLLEPPKAVFKQPKWATLGPWEERLKPHFATARQMLGVTPSKGAGETDRLLAEVASDMGRAHTLKRTEVGIFFGDPGITVPDPFFNTQGPPRAGCTLCGACMTGCKHNAKNTLDKNYLYLAEQLGVHIFDKTEVTDICPTSNGYKVSTRHNEGIIRKQHPPMHTQGVVVAAGVLGTLPLLMQCKQRGSLPNISNRLGHFVRTNSEALLGVQSRNTQQDYSHGIAIASGFYPDDHTHVEMVRYGAGHDAMGLLGTPMVNGGPPWPRWLRWVGNIIQHPLSFMRSLWPFGFAKKTGILLAMQSLPNHMTLALKRRWWWPFSKKLTSQSKTDNPVPTYFPIAHDVATRLAIKMNGEPRSVLPEVLLGISSTAHILGGCSMGKDTHEGVVNDRGELFGYHNFYVVDGSIVPGNLSVNPSLTITALGEWVMSHVPPRGT